MQKDRGYITRYFLGYDDSNHEYLVPYRKKEEWDKWVDQLFNENPDWETPSYAERIEGGTLTFIRPEIN